jgi:hypothetical protein
MHPRERQRILWQLVLGAVGAAVSVHMWDTYTGTPAWAKATEPLILELEAYYQSHGRYPSAYTQLATYQSLQSRYSLYAGESDGKTWMPFRVSENDLSILVVPTAYEFFLPVENIKPMSITSFAVWRYDSVSHQWTKGRIHWSWIGSFWSKD